MVRKNWVFLKTDHGRLCTPDLVYCFFEHVSYSFQKESRKYMNSGRITWPWIPIQIFGFPAILPWLPMSEGTQTEKNYLYSFCCGYYIKYSNHNKTVFAGPQLNFNCGPAKTVRIVTIRTIRNIDLTLFTATNRFTLAWRRGGDWRSNP